MKLKLCVESTAASLMIVIVPGTSGGTTNPKSSVRLSTVPSITVVPAPSWVLSFSVVLSGTALSVEPLAGTVPAGVATVTI